MKEMYCRYKEGQKAFKCATCPAKNSNVRGVKLGRVENGATSYKTVNLCELCRRVAENMAEEAKKGGTNETN